ncbi:uncharacterized protein LOC127849961 [Dreissena polymorpha]|uniref:uncharacterized protein LOC127849961 n=1 Tax=Dreissena polymorpha TaxID=45954 RepID=UPI00226423EB|nr:uncharacterized protein LOC127849961 [Dreissena polymorpha]
MDVTSLRLVVVVLYIAWSALPAQWSTCFALLGAYNGDDHTFATTNDYVSFVLHNGYPDMRSKQDVLDEQLVAEEREAKVLDVFPPEMVEDEKLGRNKRYINSNINRRWTRGIVPYTFDESLGSYKRDNIKGHVFGMFEYWTHIRFVPWNESVPEVFNLDHRNYLIFVDTGSCWSWVGNRKGERGQQISCCTDMECVHELGHALGLLHEINSPLRDQYIRVNQENIIDYLAANFKILTSPAFKTFDRYDMSSIMHYASNTFSKNTQETITPLDPDMRYLLHQQDFKVFYMLQEIQSVYRMQDEKCPDFPLPCANDGYVSFIDGQCRCRCPDGLEPRTGCNTPLGADLWPAGSYSLLRPPGDDCPVGFQHGFVQLVDTANARFDPLDMGRLNTLYFCSKRYDHTTGRKPTWPSGNYCVFSGANNTCPSGFQEHQASYRTNRVYADFVAGGSAPPGRGLDFQQVDPTRGPSETTDHLLGPPGSQILLEFSDFSVPRETSDKSCDSYIEIRHLLPGQPGIKYCGDGFRKSVLSQKETLSLTLGSKGAGPAQAMFKASITFITADDLCYTNSGLDDSYHGNVNYDQNYEPCVPWDRVTHCRHHVFNVTHMQLEGNMCRNPGHGTAPWCYTNAETCARTYCDVCHLRACIDLFDDCEYSVYKNPGYCAQDPEATRGCRKSCGLCAQRQLVASETCIDRRTDCRTILHRNPLMCREFPDFAEKLCRQTCRLCNITSNVQTCNTFKDLSINVTTQRMNASVGDVITYTCISGHMLVSGDLKRQCMADGTLSGSSPNCVDTFDVSTRLFQVDIRRRQSVGEHDRVYALSFLLVGSHTVNIEQSDRIVTVDIPQAERITVQPRDFIGLHFQHKIHAGIARDPCISENSPYHIETWRPPQSASWHVGHVYDMSRGSDCNIFSVNAVISPRRDVVENF